MVEQEQIRMGTTLRMLRQLGRVAKGAVGRVNMVRTEQSSIPWGFTISWQTIRVKNRSSRYYTKADLNIFEVVPANKPAENQAVPVEPIALHQLHLPFTDWGLYRGNEMIDSCETR
jgi:hypothetical protein